MYIVIALAVIILLFIVVVASRPSEFRVERSATINAVAPSVFEQVNDLHKWEAWSPWAKLDPNAKSTYAGPAAGTGASFSWDGNNKVGAGTMTIIESRPAELIRFKLEFFKPFKGTNTAEFTFKPQSNQTIVTWAMFGANSFMGKVMGLFINCEKMIGSQFEKGLADMKAIVEKK